MSIIRIKKNKENPYVILNKGFLENPDVSLRLKGFLAFCLSKPDDWRFSVRHLASVLKEGKDAIYAIINEGIAAGYIERTEQKTSGKFGSVDYIIHEMPVKKISTVSDFPDTEVSDTEKPTLLNKEDRLNNEKRERAAPPPTPPIFKYKKVQMSEEAHQSLIKDFGEALVQEMMERLDEYGEINLKKFKAYSSHSAVIRKWIREDKSAGRHPKTKQSEAEKFLHEKVLLNLNISRHPDIMVGDNYIEFISQRQYLKVSDANFIDTVTNCLRKMGIHIK